MKNMNKRILTQLIQDSAQPVTEIARKVGASRQTVSKKVEQLRRGGIITSFTVRLNPEKFGLTSKAYVFLREYPQVELRRKNESLIKRLPQVTGFHRLFGRYSALLEVWARDNRELTDLIKRIHRLKGVMETETFIVHSTVKSEPEAPFLHLLK
jgi:DNA-binding Lrp family transcriptional regulator